MLTRSLTFRQKVLRGILRFGGDPARKMVTRVNLRRRQKCRVTLEDGLWIHRYPDGITVQRELGGSSASELDAWARDKYLHQYRPQVGDTILDIGAGTGGELLTFSRSVGSSGRVVAIEAHPRTYACLDRARQLNHLDNVETMQVAITDRDRVASISDLEDHASNSLIGTMNGIRVPAKTLDQLCSELNLQAIDLLTMNIEGAESRAIHGMLRTIELVRNAVISCHDFLAERTGKDEYRTMAQVRRFLVDNGFKVVTRERDPRSWIQSTLYAARIG